MNTKKGMALLLVVILAMVSLSACRKTGTPEESGQPENTLLTEGEGFRAGFARNACLPSGSVPMRGYGDTLNRMSEGLLTELCVTCIAVTDANDVTELLFTYDLCGIPDDWAEIVRSRCQEAFGIDPVHVKLTGTHTHSSVDYEMSELDTVKKFMEDLTDKSVQTAEEALKDRSAALMYWGEVDLTGYNFLRHFVLDDGTVFANNTNWNKALMERCVGYPYEVDHTMYAVCFKREGAKDIYFTNWRAHAVITGNTKNLSADYPATFRQYVEKELDCCVGYYQGTAGNVNPVSRIAADCMPNINEIDHRDLKLYGQGMGEKFVDAVKNSEWKLIGDGTGEIRTAEYVFVGDTYDASRMTWGKKEDGTEGQLRDPSDSALKGKSGDSTEKIYVTAIGDFAFTESPNEQYAQSNDMIRSASPFEYTMVIGYSNGTHGYLPVKEAFTEPYVDTYEVRVTKFGFGALENLVDTFVEMLKTIK